jgi:hypothetical protein
MFTNDNKRLQTDICAIGFGLIINYLIIKRFAYLRVTSKPNRQHNSDQTEDIKHKSKN